MKSTIFCSMVLAACTCLAVQNAQAGGRYVCYPVQPQVIYVMPAQAGYYYPAPPTQQRATAPAQAAPQAAQAGQQDAGAFYYTPGGAVAPTGPAAPLTSAYPSPVESFEYNQPSGWWFR
jgi:hypothetical protein